MLKFTEVETMHNLSTVFHFEFIRAIKKKSFWIGIILFPAMFAVIAGISYTSSKATDEQAQKSQNEKFSLEVTDASGLVSPQLLSAFGAKQPASKAAGIASAQSGHVDAYFYYPADLSKDTVEVYAKDVGMFDNGKYSAVAKMLLQQSIASTVNSNVTVVLQDKLNISTTTYKNGALFDGFKSMVAPGVFLILFYFVIAVFGGQMMNSTVEEKENRVIEMLLTSVEPRTLIVGKILALIALGLLQVFLILIPTLLGYFGLKDQLQLPSFDLASLSFDWWRIAIGFAIFFLSFLLFTGLLVTIGAAVPTAKEAGPFIGIVMMLIFGPLYAASLFISNPEAGIVQFLGYFPFTAPIPLLLRNAVGNLQPHEILISLAILSVSTVFIINLAVRVFRYGALEYSRKLGFKEIFGR